ncbi:radical copper oxidase GlxA [Actinomycetospora lemnae]|uniref:Galactose oxidase early set domain-containing protein n=1 Tax=Actinomycetospora lemnae TaxID=3019891 RepID=A0ABT5SZ83_9PSEU|nr:galactose oxidase early set domain-containing protein [Actinomycetospora sp. DW7H6]MDD7968031.1 galactose oxidase early set domain-containing protein [Actinomycetospora sp. DW7H6]
MTVLLGVNLPPALGYVSRWRHERLVNSLPYMQAHGRWDVVTVPPTDRVNAIHAALLPTGKVLLIAGSGNKEDLFATKALKSLLYDPRDGSSRMIPVPDDMFCGGQTLLPDGRLLVAGGTARYEKLDGAVTHAAGAMRVKNEDPDVARPVPAGTEFVSPAGLRYRSTRDALVPPAAKITTSTGATVTASEVTVFVEAVAPGPGSVNPDREQYAIAGLPPDLSRDLYGLGAPMTLDKQDYQGTDKAYTFDPVTETWTRVGDMAFARWYPTLTPMVDGQVLATSGLDGVGEVLNGQTEIFDPATNTWTERKDLTRYFPTYPGIFTTARSDEMFYTGTTAGYGPADQGRVPGLWDLADNTLSPVPGLRDPDLLETAGATWVGPVQDQRMAVIGGGGIGESPRSTARIDVVDLDDPAPRFTPGPDLPAPTRYPNIVTLPDDSVLISNGSRDYRGKGASDHLHARLYHPAPDGGSLTEAAAPEVGRNYHTEGLLLPDGRVLTAGSDPLFDDENNTVPGTFEQRLEIYSPPYLFRGPRPEITAAPDEVERGATALVATPAPERVERARLLRLATSTHVTSVDQRSVALDVRPARRGVAVDVPTAPETVPSGFYMLVLVDDRGVPSEGRILRVAGDEAGRTD